MTRVKIAVDDGVNDSGIMSFAGIQSFLVKKYTAMVRNYTRAELMDDLSLCLECETDITSGRIPEAKAFELLVLKLLRAS